MMPTVLNLFGGHVKHAFGCNKVGGFGANVALEVDPSPPTVKRMRSGLSLLGLSAATIGAYGACCLVQGGQFCRPLLRPTRVFRSCVGAFCTQPSRQCQHARGVCRIRSSLSLSAGSKSASKSADSKEAPVVSCTAEYAI